MRILVTGGAGFIGSHFLDYLVQQPEIKLLVCLDSLTYAGSEDNLTPKTKEDKRFQFVHGEINDELLVTDLFKTRRITHIAHLAAESHVDNSIRTPGDFIYTNIGGTFTLLHIAQQFSHVKKFLHVSTDEVFGSSDFPDPAFNERSPYRPNSPYAASKAASDHLARAWFHTYGFPTVITNCSNNYGIRQFPEKLIPKTINSILQNTPITIHGDGSNIRDWVSVEDHCRGLWSALQYGQPGKNYCFGGQDEISNLEVVHMICDLLAEGKNNPRHLISFVENRKGNDVRYSVDISRVRHEFQWKPRTNLEQQLPKIIKWHSSTFKPTIPK